MSLSARRAWIEMVTYNDTGSATVVALRKESVDRNHTNVLPSVEVKPSLSARRAWIEIRKSAVQEKYRCVALRKESVDRNYRAHGAAHRALSRSPQGERG